MGILDAPAVSPGLLGKQTYDATDAQALRRFRTALAGRNTAACDILHIGDSITWGYKSTTQAKRWTSVFRDTLRTRFPNTTPVAGGFGFMSSIQTFGGTTPADATAVRTGGSTASSGFGLDQNAVVLSAAGNLTFTFTGTGMDIHYAQFSGGGTFSYTVDGGSTTNVSTNGATAYGSRNQAIRSLTAGSHTIVVAWVSGSVYLTGGYAYNGDEAAGIRSWNASWPSTQSSYWWDVAHNYWFESIANVAPKLVTIQLGPNDYAGASPVAVATYTTNIQNIISTIKTKAGTSPSFVLIPTWPLTPTGSPVSTWAAYVAAMYSIAAADPTNVCVNDWMLRTSSTAGTTIGGLLDADNTHPNPTGDRYLAEQLAQFVGPR